MTSERRISLKKAIPVLLIGMAVFVFYLYFFVGIPEIISIIQSVDPTFYSLAIAALLAGILFHTLAWQYLLRPLSVKVPFKKTFLYIWVGFFFDLLVPVEAVSGEISKAYLMTKDSGQNTGKVVASIVSHRILGMIITLITLIVSSVWLVILKYRLPGEILNLVLFVVSGTVISLIFLFLLCVEERITWKIINLVLNFAGFISRGRFKTASWRSKAKEALNVFRQSIGTLSKNPRSLTQPVIFTTISWFLSLFVSFFVFAALGYQVSIAIVIIVYSISLALQSIPVGIPAEVGIMEIIMTTLYSLFAIPIGVSAAATVLIRLLTVWLRMFVGLVAVQWIGIKAFTRNSR
jgi:uncharacterized protein (TIRG00374 family)